MDEPALSVSGSLDRLDAAARTRLLFYRETRLGPGSYSPERLAPGAYELRVTLTDGRDAETRTAAFPIVP